MANNNNDQFNDLLDELLADQKRRGRESLEFMDEIVRGDFDEADLKRRMDAAHERAWKRLDDWRARMNECLKK